MALAAFDLEAPPPRAAPSVDPAPPHAPGVAPDWSASSRSGLRGIVVAGFVVSSVVLLAATLVVLTSGDAHGAMGPFLPFAGNADLTRAWPKRPRLMTAAEAEPEPEELVPDLEEEPDFAQVLSFGVNAPSAAPVTTESLGHRRPHYLERKDSGDGPSCGVARCHMSGGIEIYEGCKVVSVALNRASGGEIVEAPAGSEDFMCLEICQGGSEEIVMRSVGEASQQQDSECESVARRFDGEPGHEYCRFFAAVAPDMVAEVNSFLGLTDDCFTEDGRRSAEAKAAMRNRPSLLTV